LAYRKTPSGPLGFEPALDDGATARHNAILRSSQKST
jgi:hypothetical protein